jgi:hypothetical protein
MGRSIQAGVKKKRRKIYEKCLVTVGHCVARWLGKDGPKYVHIF